MSYEVDFLKVGDAGTSGDAIALRYGDLTADRASQTVVIIDAGFEQTGPDVVDFIKKRYGTTHVDFVISTHAHRDHAAGLKTVLEDMDVQQLLMHKPWDHADEVCQLLNDARRTPNGVKEELRKEFPLAVELEEIAAREGIPITEPFEGLKTGDGVLTILGPSRSYYIALLVELLGGESAELEARAGLFAAAMRVLQAAKRVIRRVYERWDDERLEEPAPSDVTPENRSSVITLMAQDERQLLFTADAGVPSLSRAADYADAIGVDLRVANMIQVPHHGSKNDVGPSLLNRIVGPILADGSTTGKTAFVSAAKDGEPTHPSGQVLNAFVRRGAKFCATRGENIYHSHNPPPREDYEPLPGIPFQTEYDEEE